MKFRKYFLNVNLTVVIRIKLPHSVIVWKIPKEVGFSAGKNV